MKMKMKNKDSKLKSPATLCFKLCFYAFCFMFLHMCLLASLSSVVIAETAAEIDQELPQTVQKDPSNRSGHQLWLAQMSIAKEEENKADKNKLKQIIEQINSVEFKNPEQTSEPIVVPEEQPPTEPNETQSDKIEPKERQEKEEQIITEKPKLPYEQITDQTLQKLKSLLQQSDKLVNPFELGEILFLSGDQKTAALFYQEALKHKDPNDISSAQDRAWILFQLGNCLRNVDMPAAAQMYGQLITEYPNSPWTVFAKAQGKLINWYLSDEPNKLIAECKLSIAGVKSEPTQQKMEYITSE